MDSNPNTERGMGLLSQLALRQMDYQGILRAIRAGGDKSFEDGMITATTNEVGEDETVACATVLFELSSDPNREPTESDILWALEFMDHLDTLGFTVARKNSDNRPGPRIVPDGEGGWKDANS